MRALIKTIALIVRAPESKRSDFARHYEETHVPLALEHIHAWRGYARNHIAASEAAGSESFDCLSSFWYKDQAALQSVIDLMESAAGEPIRRDEDSFMDKSRNIFFAVVEEVLVGDPKVYAQPRDAKAIALLGFDSARSLASYDAEILPGWIDSAALLSRCVVNRDLGVGRWDRVNEFWFSNEEACDECLSDLNFGAERSTIVKVREFETRCEAAEHSD